MHREHVACSHDLFSGSTSATKTLVNIYNIETKSSDHTVQSSIQYNIMGLSPRKRGKLVGLVMGGTSQRKAAATVGVSKSTVWRTLLREKLHHTQKCPARSGRPPSLGAREKRRLIREVIAHPGEPWLFFANLFAISIPTVRKFAHSMGLYKRQKRKKPFLTPKAIAAR
jgi:transposase